MKIKEIYLHKVPFDSSYENVFFWDISQFSTTNESVNQRRFQETVLDKFPTLNYNATTVSGRSINIVDYRASLTLFIDYETLKNYNYVTVIPVSGVRRFFFITDIAELNSNGENPSCKLEILWDSWHNNLHNLRLAKDDVSVNKHFYTERRHIKRWNVNDQNIPAITEIDENFLNLDDYRPTLYNERNYLCENRNYIVMWKVIFCEDKNNQLKFDSTVQIFNPGNAYFNGNISELKVFYIPVYCINSQTFKIDMHVNTINYGTTTDSENMATYIAGDEIDIFADFEAFSYYTVNVPFEYTVTSTANSFDIFVNNEESVLVCRKLKFNDSITKYAFITSIDDANFNTFNIRKNTYSPMQYLVSGVALRDYFSSYNFSMNINENYKEDNEPLFYVNPFVQLSVNTFNNNLLEIPLINDARRLSYSFDVIPRINGSEINIGASTNLYSSYSNILQKNYNYTFLKPNGVGLTYIDKYEAFIRNNGQEEIALYNNKLAELELQKQQSINKGVLGIAGGALALGLAAFTGGASLGVYLAALGGITTATGASMSMQATNKNIELERKNLEAERMAKFNDLQNQKAVSAITNSISNTDFKFQDNIFYKIKKYVSNEFTDSIAHNLNSNGQTYNRESNILEHTRYYFDYILCSEAKFPTITNPHDRSVIESVYAKGVRIWRCSPVKNVTNEATKARLLNLDVTLNNPEKEYAEGE